MHAHVMTLVVDKDKDDNSNSLDEPPPPASPPPTKKKRAATPLDDVGYGKSNGILLTRPQMIQLLWRFVGSRLQQP